MHRDMKEGQLKKKSVILILFTRLAILLTLVLLSYFGGFTREEFTVLGYLLTPVCCLYLTLAFKFIRDNRYLISGNTVTTGYYQTRYLLPALLYLAEFSVILLKPLFNWLTTDELYLTVVLIECFLASYAGFYLTDLFSRSGEN